MKRPDPLNRDQLMMALQRLAELLVERGVEGHIYVVGGAAITFAYNLTRMTRDIDAIVAPNSEVFEAARQVTDELLLNEEWINDTAVAFMPEVSVDEGPVVLDIPGLVVRAAPAEVILAMKILAARLEQDAPDIKFLASLLNLKTVDEVRAVFHKYYPSGHFLERSEMLIEALFEAN